MRMTLGTKISATVVGTLALAIASSVVALIAARRSRDITETVVAENLAEARAVRELEISLLEQRGFVSSYVLSGNQRWLEELARREPAFSEWLDQVRKLPKTPEERDIVTGLDEVFVEYDDARNEVIARYDHGEREKARRLHLRKVNPLYDKAYLLCEDLVASTRARTQAEVAAMRREIARVSVIVLACVILTVTLGTGLLWVFFRGILLPLKRMAEDARDSLGPEAVSAVLASPRDELRAIGVRLQALMSDVEQTRGRLADAERLASVGKLAACVAHEIRNPLTSLKMRLFAVTREVGTDPLYEDDLRVMSEEIGRLESVIRNFLEFARPPVLKPQQVRVPAILDKTLELVRHRFVEKDIRVEREAEEGLPEVRADPQQMKQVLVNLLMNAADATGEGGEVRIASSAASDDGAPVVVIRIRDTGGGIADEAQERVFEPFFSGKDDSTGLGLSIAASIMARHGGKVELESTGPEGTVFAVHIPAAEMGAVDEQDTGR